MPVTLLLTVSLLVALSGGAATAAGVSTDQAAGLVNQHEVPRPKSSRPETAPPAVPPSVQSVPSLVLKPPPALPGSAQHHLDWLVVPLLTYDTDYKLGYGIAGQFQWAGGVDPYRAQLSFQALFTTGGRQSHWIQYDAPRFLGSKFRVWASATYAREQFAPYYGLGNTSSSDLRDHPTLYGTHPFAFDRTMPSLRVGASYPLMPHLYAFAFETLLGMQVRTYPGSLLAADHPNGVEGGHELQTMAGVYYDTRDHQAVPSRGGLFEISARGSSRGFASSYTYGGLNARALMFFPLHRRLVLATRLEGDWLTAGAPFYQLSHFGGVDNIDGVGGEFSARGIPEDRYIGRGKLIGTVELRARLASLMVRGEPLSIGAVAFTDVGRVWQFDGKDGPWYNLHAGYGAGLRFWRRSFVLRVDVASSRDKPFNFYILFGHFF